MSAGSSSQLAACFSVDRTKYLMFSRSRSGRSLLFDAAFRSPAAAIDLAIHHRSRVNAPGLHLQSNSDHLV